MSYAHEKRGFGQVSIASTDSLNLTETLTLTKWTDVRAASENTPFFGHITWTAVKTRSSCGIQIHIDLNYKFVVAHDDW